MKIGYLIFQ